MDDKSWEWTLPRWPVRCPEAVAEWERDAFLGQFCGCRHLLDNVEKCGCIADLGSHVQR